MTAKEIKQKLLDHFEANFCQCDECKLTVTYLDQLCNQLCKEQREIIAKTYEEEKYKMILGMKKLPLISEIILNAPTPKI